MAGIYIHVPFCKSFCNYCTFCRTTDNTLINNYLNALDIEIGRCEYHEPIETVYLGGGTPSSIGTVALEHILKTVRRHFDLSNVIEYTVECNPEDVSLPLAEMLVSQGVNRVSMGVQSLNDDILKAMNRRHNAHKVTEAIETFRAVGITNISVDFIYGLPQHLTYAFEEEIDKFVALNVPHLSAYALSYEEGSLFHRQLTNGVIMKSDDDNVYHQYNILTERLADAGYHHYEISNYARDNMFSRHNSSYWHRVPYYGFGPAACSFHDNMRRSNIYDIGLYIKSVIENSEYAETEYLTTDDVYNEQIMLNLRTSDGVCLDEIEAIGQKYKDYFLKQAIPFIDDGSITVTLGRYKITEKDWFISDYITRQLFV